MNCQYRERSVARLCFEKGTNRRGQQLVPDSEPRVLKRRCGRTGEEGEQRFDTLGSSG